MHPELVLLASHKCHITPIRIICNALSYGRISADRRTILAIYDNLINHGIVPTNVEDYALYLLAEHERKHKQLVYRYEDWKKRKVTAQKADKNSTTF